MSTPQPWPFPPANGPTPWTPGQLRDYKRKQLQQTEEAPW
jgi:hypothetical protein